MLKNNFNISYNSFNSFDLNKFLHTYRYIITFEIKIFASGDGNLSLIKLIKNAFNISKKDKIYKIYKHKS